MKKFLLLCLLSMTVSGCAISEKSWGTAGSYDAFKFTVTEGQTGSLTPELVAGGGAHVMLFQRSYMQGTEYPAMVGYSRRKSMWGLFSNDIGAGNVSFIYIAGSGEKPEQTAKILEAIAKVVNDERVKEKE